MYTSDPESFERLQLPEEVVARLRVIPMATRALRRALETSGVKEVAPVESSAPQRSMERQVEPVIEDEKVQPDADQLLRYIDMITKDAERDGHDQKAA